MQDTINKAMTALLAGYSSETREELCRIGYDLEGNYKDRQRLIDRLAEMCHVNRRWEFKGVQCNKYELLLALIKLVDHSEKRNQSDSLLCYLLGDLAEMLCRMVVSEALRRNVKWQ